LHPLLLSAISDTLTTNHRGKRKDYQEILTKLSQLPALDVGLIVWYQLLSHVIERFIMTFDRPTTHDTSGFWQTIVHHHPGESGQPDHYSGWLDAFMFFDESGDSLYALDDPVKHVRQ
jgi:Domain of unknown function (DUF4419)